MPRTKLTIRRLETVQARQSKYSKRKVGLLKKAKELSVLCEIDLALLMFSPTGKPSLFVGHNKDLSNVVEKMSKLSVEDREQRRGYTMKLLKKIYANSDIDPRNFSEDRNEVLQLHEEKLRDVKEKLEEKSRILREWKNPQIVNDLEQIKIMEEHLVGSVNKIRFKKRQLLLEYQQKFDALHQASKDQKV
ncbi:agamous-like MADS-box protein AGL65 [Mangifera indica]|uniref:agamous-like MADS-box protein AGL65 n=1 Tax=Mangifera indica TaxID=29780 RepID=UPI001CF9A3F9|nr:agamous-like MADS-box protein AGL65 [Mangifera indica]